MDNQQKTPQQLRAERQKYARIQRGIRLAAILVAIVLSIIALIQSCSTKKAIDDLAAQLQAKKLAQTQLNDQAQIGDSALENAALPSTAPVAGGQTITLSFVGDCTLGTDNPEAEGSFEECFQTNGASYFFQNVKSILEGDDLTVGNLEGTFTLTDERSGSLYAYKADPSRVSILAEGGIDAVNVANCHTHDYGSSGYVDTLANLDIADIQRFGYDNTKLLDISGVRVGFIGLSTKESSDCLTKTQKQIESLRAEGAQIIVVEYHWGDEGSDAPNTDQIELAHSAVDAGADVVIGHHPRIMQGVELYEGKYIAYSLGTFCYGGTQPPEDFDTMIFQQTFTLEDGVLQGEAELNMIPCSMSSQVGRNDYQPTPAEGQDAENILDKLYSLSDAVDGGIVKSEE